ncbi:DHA2 family efflux MFS transporter permease subunit [Glaesserella sp.]|uniref:DHA2 family efflux MFS transporter permease subunit n=1 Tax=Glaesserella sp. TaxID=2094731 RepID=UPI0035A147FF
MSNRQYEFFGQDPNFPTKLVTFTVLIGAFFGYLNETLLNVALTHLMVEFHIDKTTVQWMATGFLLVMGAFTPLTANVIQWFTTRTMLLVTLITFVVGTLICAFATSFPMLLGGRFIQAVSAAFTVPILFNTILLIYPPDRRGTIMGIITMMFMVAPAIGPTLSGVIVDYFGWRYLFLLTVPFILLSIALAILFLKINLQPLNRPKIDCLSVFLSILGLGTLVYSTSNFAILSLPVFGTLFVGSMILIAWFAKRQTILTEPLVDLSVFQVKQYRYAMIILAILMFVFIGAELIMPMYMQQVVLLSGTATGLILLPGSVVQAFLSPLMGNQLDKRGARPIVVPGTILMCVTFVLMMLFFNIDSSNWLLTVIFMLLPISVSMIVVSETHGLNALPKEMYPHGTAIISTINPIAGAVGAAFFVGVTHMGEKLYSTTEITSETPRLAMMSGVLLAFGIAIGMSLITLYFANKLRRSI